MASVHTDGSAAGRHRDDEPAVGRLRPAFVATVVAVALIGALCAHLLHHVCTHAPLGEMRAPEPGTARAGYCGPMDAGDGWVLLAALPALVVTAVGIALPGHPRIWIGTALVAVAVPVVLTAIAPLLDATPTI